MDILNSANQTIKDMVTRRSVRKYKADQVPDDVLEQILKAGMYAPTGMNKQAPVMVVIQNKEVIEKLSKMNAEYMGKTDFDPFYGAPTVIVVLSDKDKAATYLEDGVLVMGNLMNAAHALGVDSCYVYRAREEFETEYGKNLLAELGLEGNLVGIGHCVLGYRDCEYPEPSKRKENYAVYIK